MILKLKNWRCISEAELNISRVNVFFGGNSTGKSSVAYALYILGKLSKGEDPERCTKKLLGRDLKSMAQVAGGMKMFPVEISVNGLSVSILDERGIGGQIKPIGKGIWSNIHLMVAGRYGLLLAWLSLPGFISKEIPGKDERVAFSQVFSLLPSLLLTMPEALAPSQIFLEEILGALGIVGKDEKGSDLEVGTYHFKLDVPSPLFILQAELKFEDMLNKELKLSVNEAPSGLVDEALLDLVISSAENNSLVIIEEPEEHKNPIQQVKLIQKMVKEAKDKELTLVMTTHSEMIIYALLKEVEDGRLKPEELTLHRFIRDEEHPWTEIREIKVHEDGSIEEPLEEFMEAEAKVF